MLPSIRLYRAKGDEVATVSVARSVATEPLWLVKLARGKRGGPLGGGTVYGPYPEEVLEARYGEVLDALRAEGFARSGISLTLAALASSSRKERAFAALRLGRLRAREGVEALLAAAGSATDEICSILDALGEIGDARAIPLLRKHAERKLLSRRRSAVEALRRLKDEEGLSAAETRALASLDAPVRQACENLVPGAPRRESVAAIVEAVKSLDAKRQGRVVDTLYELGTPVTVRAAREVSRQLPLDAPFVWRYQKSVLKRAMLRRDYRMLGWLAHRIEAAARDSAGHTGVTLKSGRDGVKRETPVFRRRTQQYVLRSVWRYLRYVARYRPDEYPEAAAETVVHYTQKDRQAPRGRYGVFASCYLLHRVLWGGSRRFELIDRKLKFRTVGSDATTATSGMREEAYADRWDPSPRAYVRLLSASRLVAVQEFASSAVRARHPRLLEDASLRELLGILGAPHPPSVELGLAELDRRFDPERPDWELVERLLESEPENVRAVGLGWLERTAALWCSEPERAMRFLIAKDPSSRAAAARILSLRLPGSDPSARRELAKRILERLSQPESAEGDDGVLLSLSLVARTALVDEIHDLLTLSELIGLVERGPLPARGVGGAVLARYPVDLDALGPERAIALAQNEVAAVREAVRASLEASVDRLRSDPSILFELAESDWEDTRRSALELLRDGVELEALGPAGLVGLCDSNRVEVQDLGKELVVRHLAELDPEALLFQLAEHPHRNMRRFAMDLIERHLPAGAGSLRRLRSFFRAVLLDLWPEREMKNRVLAFLRARGMADAEQAASVVDILEGFARTRTRADFERTLELLAQLSLAHPSLASPVELVFSSVAPEASP